jgi:regulator of sirC expression with transglutaminase-like and TPR domain
MAKQKCHHLKHIFRHQQHHHNDAADDDSRTLQCQNKMLIRQKRKELKQCVNDYQKQISRLLKELYIIFTLNTLLPVCCNFDCKKPFYRAKISVFLHFFAKNRNSLCQRYNLTLKDNFFNFFS